jgi:hypothetical protein
MSGTTIETRAPTASDQESLEAELVEHAELLAWDAARLKRRCAELNRELFNACGWTADLSRRLDRPTRPDRGAGLAESTPGFLPTRRPEVTTEDSRALERRGLAVFAAVTLIPWVLVVCLLYACWRLIA